MGYIYPGTITKGKVEGKEYSKIIEWLYNLSKNKDAWGIIDKWDLRKKDLLTSFSQILSEKHHSNLISLFFTK